MKINGTNKWLNTCKRCNESFESITKLGNVCDQCVKPTYYKSDNPMQVKLIKKLIRQLSERDRMIIQRDIK